MNRRRVLLAGLFFGPLAVVAACSFPDVSFSDTTDGGLGADSPTNDGSNPADTGSSGNAGDGSNVNYSDGSIGVDDSGADAAQIDTTGCNTCDCDFDGYKDIDCGIDGSLLDGSLKPGDCDDGNQARHPDAAPQQVPTTNGDWNCDGHVTKFPQDGVTTCPVNHDPILNTTSCPAVDAVFYVGVGCGQTAEVYSCSASTPLFGNCPTPTDTHSTTPETCQ